MRGTKSYQSCSISGRLYSKLAGIKNDNNNYINTNNNFKNMKLAAPHKLYSEIESLKSNLIEMTAVNYEFDSLHSTPFQQVYHYS